MCLLIHRPKGCVIEDKYYEEAFHRNDDGGGFAWVGTDKETGEKSMFTHKGFWSIKNMLKHLHKHDGEEMIIHFRRASAGEVSDDNCHPFSFSSTYYPEYSWAVGHNGTLPFRKTPTKSDTACFMEDVLEPLLSRDPFFLDYEPGEWMLDEIIGYNNKLVIMRYDAKADQTKVTIINELAGTKFQGCWMSNQSYLPIPKVVSQPHTYHQPQLPMRGSDWYRQGTPGGATHPTSQRWQDKRKPQFADNLDLSKYHFNQTTKLFELRPGCAIDLPKRASVFGGSIVELVLGAAMAEAELQEQLRKKAGHKDDLDKKFDNYLAKAAGKIIPFPEVEGWPVIENKGAEGTAKIEVPRDAGVNLATPDVSEELFKKEQEARAKTIASAIVNPALGGITPATEPAKPLEIVVAPEPSPTTFVRGSNFHGSKAQKRAMNDILDGFMQSRDVPDWKAMTFHQKICWMRHDLREEHAPLDDLTDRQLDKWVLDGCAKMEKEYEELKKEAESEAEVIRAERQAERDAAGMGGGMGGMGDGMGGWPGGD